MQFPENSGDNLLQQSSRSAPSSRALGRQPKLTRVEGADALMPSLGMAFFQVAGLLVSQDLTNVDARIGVGSSSHAFRYWPLAWSRVLHILLLRSRSVDCSRNWIRCVERQAEQLRPRDVLDCVCCGKWRVSLYDGVRATDARRC